VLASAKGVELAQDLGVAAEKSSNQDHQEADDDTFDNDESFHHRLRVGSWCLIL
jgi:hypothetical protein